MLWSGWEWFSPGICVFDTEARGLPNLCGDPGHRPASDGAGECIYGIDDNTVRLCCQVKGSCSPPGGLIPWPLNHYEGPRIDFGSDKGLTMFISCLFNHLQSARAGHTRRVDASAGRRIDSMVERAGCPVQGQCLYIIGDKQVHLHG